MCPRLWPPYAKHNLKVGGGREENKNLLLGQSRKRQEGGEGENILRVVAGSIRQSRKYRLSFLLAVPSLLVAGWTGAQAAVEAACALPPNRASRRGH